MESDPQQLQRKRHIGKFLNFTSGSYSVMYNNQKSVKREKKKILDSLFMSSTRELFVTRVIG